MSTASEDIDYVGCGKICFDARVPRDKLRETIRRFDGQPGQVFLIERDCVPRPAIGGLGNKVPIMQELGFNSAVAGILGDDLYGYGIAREFENAGINTEMLTFMSGEATEFSLIENTGTDRIIAHYSGLTRHFTLGEREMEFIKRKRPKIVDVIYALLLPGFDGENMAEAFRTLRKEGIRTTTGVLTNEKNPYREMLKVLGEVDIFIVNDREGFYMTGEKDPARIVERLSEHTDGIVGVTLGRKGSLLRYQGKNEEGHTTRKDTPPDFTGAGDAFSAGVQASVIHDLKNGRAISLNQAAAIGSMVAEYHIYKTGIKPMSYYLDLSRPASKFSVTP